jgi:hypothetical protein
MQPAGASVSNETSDCAQAERSPQLMRHPLGCTIRTGADLPIRIAVLSALTVAAVSCAVQPGHRAAPLKTAPVKLSRIEQAMIGAAVDNVAARWSDSTELCLTVMGGPEGSHPAGDDLLAQLRTRQRAVAGNQCPPTYTSMVRQVDSAGRPTHPPRPAGYVDPYRILVSRPQFEHKKYAWIYLRQLQGTRGRAYICVAQAYERLIASCSAIDSWIH